MRINSDFDGDGRNPIRGDIGSFRPSGMSGSSPGGGGVQPASGLSAIGLGIAFILFFWGMLGSIPGLMWAALPIVIVTAVLNQAQNKRIREGKGGFFESRPQPAASRPAPTPAPPRPDPEEVRRDRRLKRLKRRHRRLHPRTVSELHEMLESWRRRSGGAYRFEQRPLLPRKPAPAPTTPATEAPAKKPQAPAKPRKVREPAASARAKAKVEAPVVATRTLTPGGSAETSWQEVSGGFDTAGALARPVDPVQVGPVASIPAPAAGVPASPQAAPAPAGSVRAAPEASRQHVPHAPAEPRAQEGSASGGQPSDVALGESKKRLGETRPDIPLFDSAASEPVPLTPSSAAKPGKRRLAETEAMMDQALWRLANELRLRKATEDERRFRSRTYQAKAMAETFLRGVKGDFVGVGGHFARRGVEVAHLLAIVGDPRNWYRAGFATGQELGGLIAGDPVAIERARHVYNIAVEMASGIGKEIQEHPGRFLLSLTPVGTLQTMCDPEVPLGRRLEAAALFAIDVVTLKEGYVWLKEASAYRRLLRKADTAVDGFKEAAELHRAAVRGGNPKSLAEANARLHVATMEVHAQPLAVDRLAKRGSTVDKAAFHERMTELYRRVDPEAARSIARSMGVPGPLTRQAAVVNGGTSTTKFVAEDGTAIIVQEFTNAPGLAKVSMDRDTRWLIERVGEEATEIPYKEAFPHYAPVFYEEAGGAAMAKALNLPDRPVVFTRRMRQVVTGEGHPHVYPGGEVPGRHGAAYTPDAKLQWVELDNPATVRERMLTAAEPKPGRIVDSGIALPPERRIAVGMNLAETIEHKSAEHFVRAAKLRARGHVEQALVEEFLGARECAKQFRNISLERLAVLNEGRAEKIVIDRNVMEAAQILNRVGAGPGALSPPQAARLLKDLGYTRESFVRKAAEIDSLLQSLDAVRFDQRVGLPGAR